MERSIIEKIKNSFVKYMDDYIVLINKPNSPKYIDRKQGLDIENELLAQIMSGFYFIINNNRYLREKPEVMLASNHPDNTILFKDLSDFFISQKEKLENETFLSKEQLKNFVEEFKKELFENFEYRNE